MTNDWGSKLATATNDVWRSESDRNPTVSRLWITRRAVRPFDIQCRTGGSGSGPKAGAQCGSSARWDLHGGGEQSSSLVPRRRNRWSASHYSLWHYQIHMGCLADFTNSFQTAKRLVIRITNIIISCPLTAATLHFLPPFPQVSFSFASWARDLFEWFFIVDPAAVAPAISTFRRVAKPHAQCDHATDWQHNQQDEMSWRFDGCEDDTNDQSDDKDTTADNSKLPHFTFL